MYDGNSSWNDLLAYAFDRKYTSYESIKEVASSGNEMFVTFSSDYRVDTGFYAKIHQTSVKARDPKATFCSVTKPCRSNEGHCYHDQQCHTGLRCGFRNCANELGYDNTTNCCYEHCNKWLDEANGILTSPYYPNNYPLNTECAWTFNAPNQTQSLKVQFVDFEASSIFYFQNRQNL